MNPIRLCLTVFIILFISACSEKSFTPNFPYNPKIVVVGYLQNNQPITIYLSLSNAPDVLPEKHPISNATIILYENNSLIDTLVMLKEGVYQINYFPKNNCKYRIEVEYANYPKLTAETYIYDPIKMFIQKSRTEYKDNPRIQYNCQIIENEKERYYGMGFYEKTFRKQFCSDPVFSDTSYIAHAMDVVPEEVEFSSNSHKISNEMSFKLINRNFYESKWMIFFNKRTLINNEIEIKLQPYFINTILLYDISPEIYESFRSMAIYRKAVSSSLTGFLLTPSAIHGNIKNGLGIFGYIFTYEFQIDSIPTSCF